MSRQGVIDDAVKDLIERLAEVLDDILELEPQICNQMYEEIEDEILRAGDPAEPLRGTAAALIVELNTFLTSVQRMTRDGSTGQEETRLLLQPSCDTRAETVIGFEVVTYVSRPTESHGYIYGSDGTLLGTHDKGEASE